MNSSTGGPAEGDASAAGPGGVLRQPKAVRATAGASVVAFTGIGLVDPILPSAAGGLTPRPAGSRRSSPRQLHVLDRAGPHAVRAGHEPVPVGCRLPRPGRPARRPLGVRGAARPGTNSARPGPAGMPAGSPLPAADVLVLGHGGHTATAVRTVLSRAAIGVDDTVHTEPALGVPDAPRPVASADCSFVRRFAAAEAPLLAPADQGVDRCPRPVRRGGNRGTGAPSWSSSAAPHWGAEGAADRHAAEDGVAVFANPGRAGGTDATPAGRGGAGRM